MQGPETLRQDDADAGRVDRLQRLISKAKSRLRVHRAFEDNSTALRPEEFRRWEIGREPFARQQAFIDNDSLEVLYGGAAAGGKSEALMMSALKYVHVPEYNALILMRSFADLDRDDALMNRSHDWFRGTPAVWIAEKKKWLFPSGATIAFGYLSHPNERFNFKSAQFQFIAFDELTQFEEICYTYMFTRLRRLVKTNVPLRVRSATNPDGPFADWVKRRFVTREYIDASPDVRFTRVWEKRALNRRGAEVVRYFVPARLEDNPHIDQEQYIESLAEGDDVTFQMLRNGDWEVQSKGKKFERKWFEPPVPRGDVPWEKLRLVRSWDLAHTSPKPGEDPDWTVGTLYGYDPDTEIRYVLDVVRVQGNPGDVDVLIKRTARKDGVMVPIAIEQEPAGGKRTIDYFVKLLKGYEVHGIRPMQDKETRANPVASLAKRGFVKMVYGDWNDVWLAEIAAFPHGAKKDQVDSFSQAERFVGDTSIRAFGSHWSKDHHLLSAREAIEVFGLTARGPGISFRPPKRCHVGRAVYVDELGTRDGAAVYAFRPDQATRDRLSASAFVFKLVTFPANLSAHEILKLLDKVEQPFATQIVVDLLPPSAVKLQETYAYEHNRSVGLWDKDPKMGIAPLRNALFINPKLPHPLFEKVMGRPELYLIVDTTDTGRPKANDSGMLALRQGIEQYYHEDNRGQTEAIEYPALMALRALASVWFADSTPKTVEELIEERMPEGLRAGDPIPEDNADGWMIARQLFYGEVKDEFEAEDGSIFFGGRRVS